MTSGSLWGLTPRQSIDAECCRRGKEIVVEACISLIRDEDTDPALVIALGGPGAAKFFDGAQHADSYWLRVWGVRGLLWVWDDSALDGIQVAMGDESWRVREMAVKVVARHHLSDALPAVTELRNADPVPRVRRAADRAFAALAHEVD